MSAGTTVLVDNTIAAAGLSALGVNTADGGNTVNVQATSVATNINTGNGHEYRQVGGNPGTPLKHPRLDQVGSERSQHGWDLPR